MPKAEKKREESKGLAKTIIGKLFPDEMESIGKIFKLALRLSKTAECTAIGLLGAVSCFAVAWYEAVRRQAESPLRIANICAVLGFVAAVSLYPLLASAPRVRGCLAQAHDLFVEGLVTLKQRNEMRKKCLGPRAAY